MSAGLCVGAVAGPAYAQHVTFSRDTDTINFPPACIDVPNRISFEAMIRVGASGFAGNIYNEILPFWYDRQFGLTSAGLYEYTHPIDSGTLWQVPAVLSPGEWHHLAYCYDGAQQRFYLDGVLLSSRARTGQIASACAQNPPLGNAAIGRVARQGSLFYESFLGDIAWIRISSTARYTTPAFVPPDSDPAADADTMLLFTFEECDNAATTMDLGPDSRHGTIGGGGTRPTFARACCPADLDNDGELGNGGERDGAVTIDDLIYFLAAFEGGSAAADLDDDGDPAAANPDGGVTIDDLLFFLARFQGGC